jgi:hypothetical protein
VSAIPTGINSHGGFVMTAHDYLINVLNGQKMETADLNKLQRLRGEIESNLRNTHGNAPRFYYGGSYGKDTLIKAAFDLDIIMYFPSTDNRSLRDIFNSVHQSLLKAKYIVNPKNVALRLPYDGGFHIDIVPGKAQDSSFQYATLYKNEENSTRQTSLKVHIDSVRKSNAKEIIKLMKLWRLRFNLPWQSFALEQTIIRALDGKSKNDYGTAMWTVLEFIRDNIQNIRLIDPANTNNVIEMPNTLRQQLRNQAANSLAAPDWGKIVW